MNLRSLAAFIAVTLIWSSTWLIIRDQLGAVPPSWSIAYRFVIAGVAMFAYAAIRRERLLLDRRELVFSVMLGALQFNLNFNLVYRAEHYVTSGLVALLFTLLIIPNALLARVFLGQPVSKRFVAGATVAIIGVCLLFGQELTVAGDARPQIATGILLTLVAVLSASISNVMQAAGTARAAPMGSMLAWAMLFGAVCDSLWAWATTGPPAMDWRPSYIAGLFYLGLIASALAFPLYFGLIRAIGPARAAWTSVLSPVIALILSTLFEGYRWSVPAALGCTLAVTGLVMALRSRAQAPAAPEGNC